jgi:hypothetical protein
VDISAFVTAESIVVVVLVVGFAGVGGYALALKTSNKMYQLDFVGLT